MNKALAWLAVGAGTMLLTYALIMIISAQVFMAPDSTTSASTAEFFQQKVHFGLTVAYGVCTCGVVLLLVGLVGMRLRPAVQR